MRHRSTLLIAASLAIAVACTSESPAAVPAAGEVHVMLEATIPTGAPEGPTLTPQELRIVAVPPDARASIEILLPVTARAARGELVLLRRRTAERWRLRGAAAVARDTLFRVVEDLQVRVDSPRPTLPLRFVYDARDNAIAVLRVAPHDTTVDAGSSFDVRVRGEDPLGGVLLPPLGWRSRAIAIASVDASGRVTALSAGSAWIVGRSWTGLADSALVQVR